jgi:hypothetical protein
VSQPRPEGWLRRGGWAGVADVTRGTLVVSDEEDARSPTRLAISSRHAGQII